MSGKTALIEIKNHYDYLCFKLCEEALDDVEDYDCAFHHMGAVVDMKNGKLYAIAGYDGSLCEESIRSFFDKPYFRPIDRYSQLNKFKGIDEDQFIKVLDVLEIYHGE